MNINPDLLQAMIEKQMTLISRLQRKNENSFGDEFETFAASIKDALAGLESLVNITVTISKNP